MIYFISDLHLGLRSKEIEIQKEDLLLRFLDRISLDCTELFIVGDLFDYWFEYKTVIPRRFFRTVTKLYELRKDGMKITYLMGNHDFGHYDFFREELDIEVIDNDVECDLFGKRFFISHGDGKSYNDRGYLILKAILRNPLSNKLYRYIHPDCGIGIAANSSKRSRKYTEVKDFGKTDGMKDFALQKLSEGFDFVVMGHRHKAELIESGSGKYINLGEWINTPTFGIFDGEEIKLLEVYKFLGENELK